MTTSLIESLQLFSDTNQWLVIWPELALALGALLLLFLELISSANQHKLIPSIAFVVQIVILAVIILGLGRVSVDGPVFSGLIAMSDLGHWMRVFLLISSILVCSMATRYFAKQGLPRIEFYAIVMIVTAAMMLLVHCEHMVMFFVALETVTIGFYILVSYSNKSAFSLEAGLKYLILGALSSGILLMGIVLLYGTAGGMTEQARVVDGFYFSDLALIGSALFENPVAILGAMLVLSGLAFKMGVFPFQIWVPDVYQGAPTPTTAFLAVSSKAVGFAVLLKLVGNYGPFHALQDFLFPVMASIAAITILFGNITALGQQNVKRLMGLSGIAHAGYLLVGVLACLSENAVSWALYAVLFYLFTYMIASFCVFGVMSVMGGTDDENQELEHYIGLSREHPFLGGVLAIGLSSLAGIPPMVGFIAKLLLFVAAFQAGLYSLLAVSIIGVVISIYYYFGWIREAFFRGGYETHSRVKEPWVQMPSTFRLLLLFLAALVVLLGFYPKTFDQVVTENSFTLRNPVAEKVDETALSQR